jgi:hypothetical protein
MPTTDASTPLTWADIHRWVDTEHPDPEASWHETLRNAVSATISASETGHEDDARYRAVQWLVASDVDHYYTQHTPSMAPIQQALIALACRMDDADNDINGGDDGTEVTYRTVSMIDDARQVLDDAIEAWMCGLERRADR